MNSNKAIATIIGNIAAAIECEKEGNIPISPNDVITKINQIKNINNP